MVCLNTGIVQQRLFVVLAYCCILHGLLFAVHKVGLLYAHVQVRGYLERLTGDDLSRQIWLDGIPAYAEVVVVTVTMLVMIAKSLTMPEQEMEAIRSQKKYIVVAALIVITFGGICTVAEVSIVLFEDILMFISLRAADMAECYCMQLPSAEPHSGVPIPADQIEYWCRCNIPGEEHPVAFSVVDPYRNVNIGLLRGFMESDKYERSELTLRLVDNKPELMRLTDSTFSDIKVLLAMAQLSVFFVVLRLPMFVVMARAMNKDLMSERRGRDNNNKKDISLQDTSLQDNGHQDNSDVEPLEQRKKILAARSTALAENIAKSVVYKDMKSVVLANTQLFLEVSVYALIESLDAYSLLDDVVDHRYTFGSSNGLAILILILVTINNIIVQGSSIIVFFGGNSVTFIPLREYLAFARGETNRGDHTEHHTKFWRVSKMMKLLTVAMLSNLPYLGVRIYLLWAYDGFNAVQVGSIYVIFIMKEVFLFVLGVIEFTSNRVRIEQEIPLPASATYMNEAFDGAIEIDVKNETSAEDLPV